MVREGVSAAAQYETQENNPNGYLSGLFAHDTASTADNQNTPLIAINGGKHDETVTETISETTEQGEFETFEMPAPWHESIYTQLHTMIASYDFDGAMELIAKYTNAPSGSHQNGIYETLDRALEDLSQTGFGYQTQQFTQVFNTEFTGIQNSYAQLGMNSDFFMTGPNAGDTFEGPVVETNRTAVQAHFEGEIHKPLPFVQPYLGVNLG